tara:strand:+ start:1717 stop:2025 length:309 start_codon:yes stop_codon:yes gene_type:complete
MIVDNLMAAQQLGKSSMIEREGILYYVDEFMNETLVDSLEVAEVTAEVARLQAEYDSQEYARDRATAYPPIGDQLDAIWKGGEAEADMLATVQAVKAKYPKA